jgi:RES domain-containing protein
LQAGRSPSRWCNGAFDVLYTSLERDGAIAEVHELLSLQPVFPSKISFFAHRLKVSLRCCLHLAAPSTLSKLGVDTERYPERSYGRTHDIADAAHFLGFDSLIVPNARWRCTNTVLFTERIEPACLELQATEPEAIDWQTWRRQNRAGAPLR